MFTTNVGTADRVIRVLLGLALIGFALYGPAETPWKSLGWIGILPIFTALFGTCPLYSLLGMSSTPANK